MCSPDDEELARAVRDICLRAADRSYHQGLLRGLCRQGAFELALDAMRRLETAELLAAGSSIPQQPPGARSRDRT